MGEEVAQCYHLQCEPGESEFHLDTPIKVDRESGCRKVVL